MKSSFDCFARYSSRLRASGFRLWAFGFKPFAFCFPLFALSFLLSALISCRFNPEVRDRGLESLQGTWEQHAPSRQAMLLSATRYTFTFTCDSFYAEMNTQAKVKQYPGDCFNGGKWTEYAKGTYVTRQDTVFINATFTHSNFKQKLSGCYRIGQYLPVFVLKAARGDTLRLKNIAEDEPLLFTLKTKLVCQP